MTMKTIVVASKNPVKINATKEAFEKVFPKEKFIVIGSIVPSGVSDQPMSDEETLLGAKNRAQGARKKRVKADYWVGLEGGIDTFGGDLVTFAWGVILDRVRSGEAKSASMLLPKKVVELIHQGKELGDADDIVFNRKNSKQENGTVGILTNDAITRTDLYRDTVILALIPFLNPTLYPKAR